MLTAPSQNLAPGEHFKDCGGGDRRRLLRCALDSRTEVALMVKRCHVAVRERYLVFFESCLDETDDRVRLYLGGNFKSSLGCRPRLLSRSLFLPNYSPHGSTKGRGGRNFILKHTANWIKSACSKCNESSFKSTIRHKSQIIGIALLELVPNEYCKTFCVHFVIYYRYYVAAPKSKGI